MARIETWLKCDLKKAVKVQYLHGNLFSQDNQANLIGAELYDNGAEVTASGTVTANIIREDGATVTATGSTSGNKASVVLPAAAYAIPGAIAIVIKITLSGVITTIAAVVGTVYRSSTDTPVDPGTIMPSIQTLISQIQTAVASIPSDYSSLWTSLAPAFSASTDYAAGQHVTNNGKVYRFNTAHTAGAWVASEVTEVKLGNEISDLKAAIEYEAKFNGLNYKNLIGLDSTVYYPVEIPVGTVLTMSTADGEALGQNDLNLIGYDENKQQIDIWNFNSSYSKRTITWAKGKAYYLGWSKTPAKNVQVEFGNSATEYFAYNKPLDYMALQKWTQDEPMYERFVYGKNFIGSESGVYYPVYITPGTKFTMSTSDGSTLQSDIKLRMYNENKQELSDYWTFRKNTSERTVTQTSTLGTAYYMKWDSMPPVPFQVEIGTKTTYEPYIGNVKYLYEKTEGLDGAYGQLKALKPFNLYSPAFSYSQINSEGTSKSGYTINNDGSILCKRDLGSYGSLYLLDKNETNLIGPGIYEVTADIEISSSLTPTLNTITVNVGRQNESQNISILNYTTNEPITVGERSGYIKKQVTLTSSEVFSFMIMARTASQASSDFPLTIKNIVIRKLNGDEFDKNSFRDQLFNEIFNAEPSTGSYDWQTPVVSYGALFNGKDTVESFAFFTDPHIAGFGDSSRNEARFQNYLKRVQKVYNATPCSFIVSGGDWLNNSTTMDEACYRLGLIKGVSNHLLDGCKLVLGNHDTNYQGKKDSESETHTGRLTNETIASIWYRDTNTKKAYYSFDGANSKCYVLDTGTEHNTMLGYDWEQVDWLAEQLINDDAPHSIIFLHIIINETLQTNASTFGSLVEAYNGHTTITLNGETYDFTSCTGRVEFWVAGHMHNDSTGTLGGIPYFLTATNSYTSDVPLIDLVLADYDNRVINIVRVGGTGADRTISLT